MWIHISKIAKTIIVSTQTEVETFQKLIPTIPSTIIVENTENSPNSSSYTIECKNSEKFSPIVSKVGIFSSATAIVLNTKMQIAHTQIIKAAINCFHIYCEEDYGKCYKHTPSFFKHTFASTGVTNAQITKTNKTCIYCKLQHKQI